VAGTGGLSGAAAAGDAVALVREHSDVPTGPLVIALSGGADSAVCAWAALDAGAELRAVFVDHGFAESAQMAEAARSVASHLGVLLDEVPVEVPTGPSPEGQARSVRLAALEGALESGETLLTGHTADDQAETVLGNVLRGSGAAGLAGIPGRRDRWARPLLEIDRATVRAAADALGLPYVDDPTNASLAPRRNRLRHQVLPRLREEFNPQLTTALLRTASSAAADEAVLEENAARVPLVASGSVVKVPAAALVTLPRAVAARVVRRALRVARGPHAGEAAEVDAVLGAAGGSGSTIGGGIHVAREGPWVVLSCGNDDVRGPITLEVPGVTEFWGGSIAAELVSGAWRPLGPQVTRVDEGVPLEIVVAAPDDRVDFGGGSKTVGAAMAEAGIAPRLRARWPAVVSRGIIHWIVGVRSAPVDPRSPVVLSARLEER
jgi:tRNA(Ile)-lysidine synthase